MASLGVVQFRLRTLCRLARATAVDRPCGPPLHVILYRVNFLQHNAAGLEHEAAELKGSRDGRMPCFTRSRTPPHMAASLGVPSGSTVVPTQVIDIKK